MKINPVVGMVIFRKIRGSGGNPPTWHLWKVTSFDSKTITMQGSYRDEMGIENFQGEVDTDDIYVCVHDEYEAAKDRIRALEVENKRLQDEVDVLTNNAGSWQGRITSIVSAKNGTVASLDLIGDFRTVPGGGEMVSISLCSKP